MNSREDRIEFTPEDIDEQIEQLLWSSNLNDVKAEDVQLIYHLQQVCGEQADMRDRVWMRLSEQKQDDAQPLQVEAQEQQPGMVLLPPVQLAKKDSGGKRYMQHRHFPGPHLHVLQARFVLIAATFIAILTVGSVLWVLLPARHATQVAASTSQAQPVIEGKGTITSPQQRLTVAVTISSLRVVEVMVKAGDQVKAKQPLFAVDTSHAYASTPRDQQALASLRKDNVLTSHIDGLVTVVNIKPGATITGGTALVVIDDLSKVVVEAELPRKYEQRIQPGHAATVTAAGLPGQTFTGTILSKTTNQDSTMLAVELQVINDKNKLHPGMDVSVHLT